MIEAAFLLFFLLLFLSLGTSLPVHSILGTLLIAGTLWNHRKELTVLKKSPPLLFLFAFLGYLILRSLLVLAGIIHLPGSGIFPFKWFVGSGVLLSAHFLFTERARVRRLLWTGAFAGLFLALNALPALFRAPGTYGYNNAQGESGFFLPIFYFHPYVEKYFLSRLTHVNYAGDLLGVGFFCALGLLIYALTHWHKKGFVAASSLGIPAVILLATAGSLLLFLARGTILSFGFALAAYFVLLMLKFRGRTLRLWTAAVGLGGMISLLWIVNPVRVWQEIATVEKEWKPEEKARSLAANEEGGRRALLIFKDHPFWGVGTDGFRKVSKDYSTGEVSEGEQEAPFLASAVALCHYLQVLAEEGVGAFLYFLFILFFLVEAFRGLPGIQSRFQFVAVLSLLAAAGMILMHATIHYLMELFPFFLLFCVLAGALLGILRGNFKKAGTGP